MTFSGTAQSNSNLSFETILLPLRHNGTTNSRIIGALTAMDEPYWLGLHPILEQRISGLRLIWPDDHAADLGNEDLSAGLGARVSPFASKVVEMPRPSTAGRRRYAHLAVIDGGRS